ncbi:MAG: hypothetical protein ACYC27_08660 [Armatimonadota bacterium]
MKKFTLRSFRCLAAVVVLMAVLVISTSSQAGTYKDREGTAHTWTIDANHALQWDGAAYVPFGVVFNPRYLADTQTDADLSADKADIDALKAAGVTDIMLRPGKGVGSVPVEAFQRVIDMLEESGLRYGVQLTDAMRTPLTGYVIQPAVNRVDNIQSSGDVSRNVGDAKYALYVVADAKTGSVKNVGQASSVNSEINVPVMLRSNANHVFVYYPFKSIPASIQNPNIPDIWKDYDRFRDTAVSYLSGVKFGKGLRFFSDPFGDAIGMAGESIDLVPASSAYRLEYAAWLSKKHSSTHALNLAWGITQYEVKSFAEAAGFIPLWNKGRGIQVVYDDVNGKRYPVEAVKSTVWADFESFRNSSIKSYLNSMADVIKRYVADVPVIHTVNGLNPLFQVSNGIGYDGLAVPALSGDDMTTRAGYVLSMAENSPRKPWLVSRLVPADGGYAQKDTLFSAMNTLHSLGSKGFFIDAALDKGSNIPAWIGEYSSVSTSDKYFASYEPKVIYYQLGSANASIKKLTSGSWWLPTLASGKDLYLGSDMAGYALDSVVGYGPGVYIWSLKGNKTITIASNAPVSVSGTNGDTVDLTPKKGRVSFTVTEDPSIIRGIRPDEFMTVEIVASALKDLQDAITKANLKKMDTGSYQSNYAMAKKMMDDNSLLLSLQMSQSVTNEINHRLQGLEGQSPEKLSTPASILDKKDKGTS